MVTPSLEQECMTFAHANANAKPQRSNSYATLTTTISTDLSTNLDDFRDLSTTRTSSFDSIESLIQRKFTTTLPLDSAEAKAHARVLIACPAQVAKLDRPKLGVTKATSPHVPATPMAIGRPSTDEASQVDSTVTLTALALSSAIIWSSFIGKAG